MSKYNSDDNVDRAGGSLPGEHLLIVGEMLEEWWSCQQILAATQQRSAIRRLSGQKLDRTIMRAKGGFPG